LNEGVETSGISAFYGTNNLRTLVLPSTYDGKIELPMISKENAKPTLFMKPEYIEDAGLIIRRGPGYDGKRFEEEQKVFKAIYYAIQDTLLKAELIANSETQMPGKMERDEGEEMNEGEEQKSTISGLFRKIAKNADDFGSNNVIESIYRSKNGEFKENEEVLFDL